MYHTIDTNHIEISSSSQSEQLLQSVKEGLLYISENNLLGCFFLNQESIYTLMCRACNLTSFSLCLTGPVDYPIASRHKGSGFKSPGGYLCETGILLLALSRYTYEFMQSYLYQGQYLMCYIRLTIRK
jgi:hypothetical protein